MSPQISHREGIKREWREKEIDGEGRRQNDRESGVEKETDVRRSSCLKRKTKRTKN